MCHLSRKKSLSPLFSFSCYSTHMAVRHFLISRRFCYFEYLKQGTREDQSSQSFSGWGGKAGQWISQLPLQYKDLSGTPNACNRATSVNVKAEQTMACSVELNLQGSCSARLPEPADLQGMPEGLSVLQGCFKMEAPPRLLELMFVFSFMSSGVYKWISRARDSFQVCFPRCFSPVWNVLLKKHLNWN